MKNFAIKAKFKTQPGANTLVTKTENTILPINP